MKLRAFFLALVVASCARHPAKAPELHFPTPLAAPVVIVEKPPVPPHVVAPSEPSPDAVLKDSETYRDEATRYVAWKNSKPANIETLTSMTAAVTDAIHAMKASRAHGHYDPVKVIAARAAVDALREFLAHKQD